MHEFKLAVYDSGGKEKEIPFDSFQISLAENTAAVQYTVPSRPELAYLPPGTRLVLHMRDSVDGKWKYLIDSYVFGVYRRKTPVDSISIESEVPLGRALLETVRYTAMFLTSNLSSLPVTYSEFELYSQTEVPDVAAISGMDAEGNIEPTPFLLLLRELLNADSDEAMLKQLVGHMLGQTETGRCFEKRYKVSGRFGVLFGDKSKWLQKYGLTPTLFKLLASLSAGIPQANLSYALSMIASPAGYGLFPQLGMTEAGKQFILQPYLITAAAPSCNTVLPHEILMMDIPVNYKYRNRILGVSESIIPASGLTFPLLKGKLVGVSDVEGKSASSIEEVDPDKKVDVSSGFASLSSYERIFGITAATVPLTMNQGSLQELYKGTDSYKNQEDPFLMVNTARMELMSGFRAGRGSLTTLFNPYAIVGLPVTILTGGVPYHGRVNSIRHMVDNVRGIETTSWDIIGMHMYSNSVMLMAEPCEGLSGQADAAYIDKLYKDTYGVTTIPGLSKGGEKFWTGKTNAVREKLKPTERFSSLMAVEEFFATEVAKEFQESAAERLKYRKLTESDVFVGSLSGTSTEVFMEIDDMAAALVDLAKKNDTDLVQTGRPLSAAETVRRGKEAVNLVNGKASSTGSVKDIIFGDMVPKLYRTELSSEPEFPSDEELEEPDIASTYRFGGDI